VKVSVFQLVQEGSLGDVELSPKVRIILTGNRASDKAGATELPSPLKNRVMLLDMQPDLEEWMAWAHDQGLPGVIGAFLQWKPAFFAQTPADADKENGQFATPREWENVGLMLLTVGDAPEGVVHTFAAGQVGLGVATEFCAFMKLQKELPDPKLVLEDPVKYMPKPPAEADRLTALVTALGDYAANHQGDKKIYLQLLHALSHCAGRTKEAVAAGLTVFQANGGSVQKLFETAAANRTDPKVAALIKYFAASVA
jgi:hypothetical protein